MDKRSTKADKPASFSKPGSSGNSQIAPLNRSPSTSEQTVASKPSTSKSKSNHQQSSFNESNKIKSNAKSAKIEVIQDNGNISSAQTPSQNSGLIEITNEPDQANQCQPPVLKTISSLSNEMLRLVLERLETHTQFNVRSVSRRWKDTVEAFLVLTRCLHLNLTQNVNYENTDRGLYHLWNPRISINSNRSELNRFDPPFNSNEIAKLTFQPPDLTPNNMNLVVGLLPNIQSLVIYYDFDDNLPNLNLLYTLIEQFDQFNSFDIIRAMPIEDINFVGNICNTLLNTRKDLKRLNFYVSQGHRECLALTRVQENIENFMRNFPHLNNFSVAHWGFRAEPAAQALPNEVNSEIVSLGVPFRDPKNVKLFRDMSKLANVRKLQLFDLKRLHLQVEPFVESCPQLQSLELHYVDYADFWHYCDIHSCPEELFGDPHLELIAQQEHLTELKVFNRRFSLRYIEGIAAPNIQKLTIGIKDFFSVFFTDPIPYLPKRVFVPFAEEFVRFIRIKFPGLLRLNVLTHEREHIGVDLEEQIEIAKSIRRKFKRRMPSLTFKVHFESVYLRNRRFSLISRGALGGGSGRGGGLGRGDGPDRIAERGRGAGRGRGDGPDRETERGRGAERGHGAGRGRGAGRGPRGRIM